MRCPKCKEYNPDGLGLKRCLHCQTDLTVTIETDAEENISEAPSVVLTPPPRMEAVKPSSGGTLFMRCFMAGLLLLGAILAGLLYLPGTGRSYYIDDDVTEGDYVPDNRIFQYQGHFFGLTVYYPADMYAPVLGQEVFLRRGGCTHFLNIAVTSSERQGLPVRYRVRSIELTNGDSGKIYPFLLFQTSLYSDELRKLPPSQSAMLLIRQALQQSTRLLPQLDFSTGTNIDGLYFGYDFKSAPKHLYLSFEIEIYKLGGESPVRVRKSIRLTRVDGDPMDWIKKQMRRNK